MPYVSYHLNVINDFLLADFGETSILVARGRDRQEMAPPCISDAISSSERVNFLSIAYRLKIKFPVG
jgi:hypothetical protein